MNPIYKFELSAGEDSRQAFPVYKDDLAIDYALEQSQQFYRGKLSGKLTFQRDDYTFIRNKPFDTQFDVVISISYDGGQTWAVYWSGQFWKTDCQFNEDDQTAIVTPTVNDRYNAVLAGMEKEYNLIDLAPVMQPVSMDKRPMIQVYVPGQTVIGCFLSGMWWEQECEAVEETDTVNIDGDDYPALTHKYFFALNKSYTDIQISGDMSPQLPENVLSSDGKYFDFIVGNYGYRRQADTTFDVIAIYDANTGIAQWTNPSVPRELEGVYSVTLYPVAGEQSTGNVTLDIVTRNVYARYITDVESALGTDTHPIPDDDLVENNRNYSRVTGYNFPNTIQISTQLSATPTKWGIYQPGQYYEMFVLPSAGINESYPIARATWGRVSMWFVFDLLDWQMEQSWRKEYTLKDAYPIWSVIAVLLGEIAPNITHAGTNDYSRFLYDVNPFFATVNQRLFIAPKSNLIAAGYDQPAQKAPITLKRVLDMLRDCFRCYWFIDASNKFRIEHVSYFMNGGAYPGTPNYPVVGINLTEQMVSRNGKPWAYARNQYQFDKPDMASRYQFGWMDDVTEYFEGFPIEILSKYVNPDSIEQIEVSQFTSDVDYILLNPSAISKDGFVLMAGKSYAETDTAQAQISQDFGYVPIGQGVFNFVKGRKYRMTANVPNGQTIAFCFYRNSTEFIILDNGVPYEFDAPTNADGGYIYGGSAIFGQTITITLESLDAGYKLPYVNFSINGSDHILQNAWAAFIFLQNYYRYDMPAKRYAINGVEYESLGIKKLKTQTIKFPVLTEPDMFNLIKTELGDGTIQKMSVNLSSRNANTTLKYDTE